ncbi:MAG: prenyltransferase [Candidatus Aenigmarchaeota archaeon]|nr:prenyltransferase [Candidatus Aenigmarchaeota archaeon]
MLGIWLRQMRAPFLTASVIPVLIGAAYAHYLQGGFSLQLLAVTLLGVACLHLGANLANEYFDFKGGTDVANRNRNPFSGGSGLLPSGSTRPGSVRNAALLFFLLAALAGAYLSTIRGPVVLLLGLVGALSGFLYAAPRANLAGRGIGELLVGLNFGVLIVLGTFFVQTASLSWKPVIASLPITFLIAAVLYVNQFPDYDADKATGKKNIVVRLGREKAARIYIALMFLTYVSLALAIAGGFLPPLSALSFLTFPLAIKSTKTLMKHHSSFPQMLPANAFTVLNHLITGLVLAASVTAASFI